MKNVIISKASAPIELLMYPSLFNEVATVTIPDTNNNCTCNEKHIKCKK